MFVKVFRSFPLIFFFFDDLNKNNLFKLQTDSSLFFFFNFYFKPVNINIFVPSVTIPKFAINVPGVSELARITCNDSTTRRFFYFSRSFRYHKRLDFSFFQDLIQENTKK